jgi:hypothetical protein
VPAWHTVTVTVQQPATQARLSIQQAWPGLACALHEPPVGPNLCLGVDA